MRSTPDMFLGLHLEYIINGQSHARRNVQITGSSISSGKLFTKLENMPNLDEDGVRYLSSEDMKKIVDSMTLIYNKKLAEKKKSENVPFYVCFSPHLHWAIA